MNLTSDKNLKVTFVTSRMDKNCKSVNISQSALFERFEPSQIVRSPETMAEYLKMSKSQQDNLKDIGGFIGGTLDGKRRKKSAITGMTIIILDADAVIPYGSEGVCDTLNPLGCGYLVHSTRKHRPEAPRLRIIIVLNRTVTADEYEAIGRWIAQQIGIQMVDPTTFDCSRLYYWPSCCSDGEYFFQYKDAPPLDADKVLATYTDWHDFTSWPQVPGAVSYQKLAMKQGDPESKPGVVGAFNRAYGDVFTVMDKLIPGIYEPVDTDPNRYTYLGGSTTGGAIIYDNGKFLYSHHATDPCSGKLVNAFDLVRLHKFGDKDDEAAAGTPTNRLPSFKAMCEFAVADPTVSALMAKERHEQALKDFEELSGDTEKYSSDDTAWLVHIKRTQNGGFEKSISNIEKILNNDPLLKGRFALNQFSGRCEVLGKLPWNNDNKRRVWSDTDSNGLYSYLELFYGISSRNSIDSAWDLSAASRSFNEVQDYLNRLEWDGVPRLDTLFIDYLGAEDDEAGYTRAVCRKAFTAAVARAMTPGCKYDCMLILCGPQGIGKSTLLDKMSRGWFNDSIRTFEGKEASELLQGVWIVEVAELDAFRKSDVARIKQFLSLRVDRYRAAYGRNVKELPRCCVFFGTCNQSDFLQDTTGNRRFWPVEVGIQIRKKTVWKDLTEDVIHQIWAEAKVRWQMGEQLFLPPELEKAAREHQEAHREVSPKEGLIQEFVSRQVPDDWLKWPLDRRRDYWANNAHGDYKLVDRDRICALEIWCELFYSNQRDMKTQDVREINATLANIPGWKRGKSPFYCGPYPNQRGFVRR